MAIGVFRRQNNMAARTIIVALMTLLLTAAATADVLRVPLEYQSIQEAVMFSAEADTILISDGLYQEHLSIPGHSLTIASRFLLDGDTTHIGATLLDGAHQGTVVNINGDRGRWYRFVGLTIERGLGGSDGQDRFAGGVNICGDASVAFSSCVLRDHHSTSESCASAVQQIDGLLETRGALVFESTLLMGSDDPESLGPLVWTSTLDSIRLENVTYCRDHPGGRDQSIEVVQCSDALVRGLTMTGLYGGVIRLQYMQSAIVEDVLVSDCDSSALKIYSFEEGTSIRAKRISVSGNRGRSCSGISSIVALKGDTLMCDSVSVTDNLCLGVSAFEAFGYGYFTRAWVHDNVSGDSTGVLDEPSSLFGVGRAAISHVSVNNNRKFTYRLGDISGICGFSPIWPPDSAYAEDIVVEDNTIYDRREIDYSDDEAWYNGIEGIACSFNLWGENVSVIRDCVFRNNTTSQPIREYFIYHSPVGSNVTISGGASHSVLIENLLIEAANDGGIWADMASGAVTMRNIVLRDVDRYGIRFHDSENGTFPGNHVFENILIENSDEYCMELPYPYIVSVQQAFSATCARRSIEARNVSFIGCNYTIANKLSETEFLNCLETDFHYQIRQHPIYADSPVSFRYCNTETLQPGTGNISQPPRFDPERGIPFLAPDSPCIDAGHPDAAYNDIEDPDAPGFALWPSQGSLRNDIGCTGGPLCQRLHVRQRRALYTDHTPHFPRAGRRLSQPLQPNNHDSLCDTQAHSSTPCRLQSSWPTDRHPRRRRFPSRRASCHIRWQFPRQWRLSDPHQRRRCITHQQSAATEVGAVYHSQLPMPTPTPIPISISISISIKRRDPCRACQRSSVKADLPRDTVPRQVGLNQTA